MLVPPAQGWSDPLSLIAAGGDASGERLDLIQPHGWMLVLDPGDRRLIQAGANLPALLGMTVEEALGRTVADLLGPVAARALDRAIAQAGADAIGPVPLRLDRDGQRRRLIAHGQWDDGGLILELEEASPLGDAGMVAAGFGAAIRRYRHIGTVADLAPAVAQDLRRLTGYDRALFVRMPEGGQAEIVSVAAAPGSGELPAVGFVPLRPLETTLLELNRARLVHDMGAEPVALLPAVNPLTSAPLDLSRVSLRHPTSLFQGHGHRRQVRGVLAVTLLVGGRMWGYLWCESVAPHAVSPSVRALCEALGEIVAAQIATLEERASIAARTAAARGLTRLSRLLRQGVQLTDGLMAAQPVIRELLPHASMIAGIEGSHWASHDLAPLSHWLEALGAPGAARREGIAWRQGVLGIDVPDGHVVLLRDGQAGWSHIELELAQELHHLLAERQAEIYRRRTEQQLHVMANFDRVTGLPNRAHILQALQQALGVETETAVTVIGLDRFRALKATLGEADSDALLAAVGKRLRDCVPAGDLLGRIDTGEFAVLSFDGDAADRAERIAHTVRDALRAPLSVAGREMFVTASLGVVPEAQGASDATTLLRDAEIASAEAEAAGGGGRRVFDAAMRARLTERHVIYDRLRQAIYFTNGVRPVFQPIVRLADGELAGFEALARWTDPDHGPIPPTTFVSVAEETGLIVPLGNHILVQSCRQIAKWNRGRAGKPLYVSVNLSPYQLDPSRLDIVRWVTGVLEMTECRPEWLRLEITESGLIGQGGEAITILQGLRDLGIGLAIDDFGTGYSSLAYLQNLPVDTIKIDRSFVTGMARDEKGLALVSAILHIAGIMEFGVVAEGVETEAQEALLRQMGCDRAQGYLFAKPLEADMATALVHHAIDLHEQVEEIRSLRAGRWG
ncbi:EAL domain-containing protein [Niveispirillum sp.]|uniref:EAL domain-containing protein n=1 Tax=Niveispirillum sp. TaxID=1917217 RepID=UPI001B4A5C82|nr:EAL domain-containing protein [Niveispirillum sp.]MBP7334670.1 EAL domain-containing protein [Niveispirillum sp.]